MKKADEITGLTGLRSGVCGVVGGKMVIEMLAGTMRLDRISPEAVGRAAKRALCGVRNCRGG